MNDFQNDEVYKSLLKTFVHYSKRIIKARHQDGVDIDDASEYMELLVSTAPVAANLAQELQAFYGSSFSVEFSEINGNINKIENLILKLDQEIKHNPNFENVPLTFKLSSPQLETSLKSAFDYTQSDPQDYFEDKAMYWLYNALIAADCSILELRSAEEDKLWSNIEHSDIAVLVASKLRSCNNIGNEEANDEYIQDLEAGIFDTCIEIISDQQSPEQNTLESLLDNYRQNCDDMNVDEDNYAELFSPYIPAIEKIINFHKPNFIHLDNIATITDDFNQKIWSYDHQSIADIIGYQSEKNSSALAFQISSLKFDQAEMDEVLQDKSYQPLIAETKEQYQKYQSREAEIEHFEQYKITNPALTTYFSAMLKVWANNTSDSAGFYSDKAFSLGIGMKDTSPISEQIKECNEMLQTAKDIILIGRISSEFIYEIDENRRRRGVQLCKSGLSLDYIENLIKDPEKIKNTDYENIGLLFTDFHDNCNEEYEQLQMSGDELYIYEETEINEFAAALNFEPASKDKYKYTYYTERMTEGDKNHWVSIIGKNIKQFAEYVRPLYEKEYNTLKDYTNEGYRIFPQLKNFDVLEYTENIVNSVVLIPLYAENKDFTENDWNNYLESSMAGDRLDDVGRSFILSAANGYRRQVLNKYPEIKLDPHLNQAMKILAQANLSYNESWDSAFSANTVLKTSLLQQEGYINEIRELQDYHKKYNPAYDPITKAILNFHRKSH